MCGLCGLLGEDLHWSDPLGDELPRRRERLRRIAAINQVLAVFRLKVEDFQGASYLLLGATGKQELASGLDQLWQAAETMLGRPLDPLDPRLLDHLELYEPGLSAMASLISPSPASRTPAGASLR